MESLPRVAHQRGSQAVSYAGPAATRTFQPEYLTKMQGRGPEDPQVLNESNALQWLQGKKTGKSLSSSLGLGDGFAGGMTAAALLVLLLITIGTPAALLKQHMAQAGTATSADESLPLVSVKTVKPELPEANVPVTPKLQESFRALELTGKRGILFAAGGDSWAAMREGLLEAIQEVNAPVSRESQQGTELEEKSLRKAMAMDLVCLENAAVKAQVEIDEAAGNSGDSSAETATKYMAKIEARRRQAKAAELWATAVKGGLLGQDKDLQNSILQVLTAVRCRAAASEYLCFATMTAQQAGQAGESIKTQNTEAHHVYEATASLAVAGQIAATNPLIADNVAEWLPIIFISV